MAHICVHMQEQGVWLLLSGNGEPHLSLALSVWWDGSPTLHMHVQGGERAQVWGFFCTKVLPITLCVSAGISSSSGLFLMHRQDPVCHALA